MQPRRGAGEERTILENRIGDLAGPPTNSGGTCDTRDQGPAYEPMQTESERERERGELPTLARMTQQPVGPTSRTRGAHFSHIWEVGSG